MVFTMNISDLAPNPKNPRKISSDKQEALKRSLLEFGDLSGIVYNTETKRLVGGHQRVDNLPKGGKVEITATYKKPTATGTVREGYYEIDGDRFSYREVKWDESKEQLANIAANKNAGEWDFLKLGEAFKELEAFGSDLDFSMFTELERNELFPELVKVGEHTRSGPTGVDEDEVPEQVEPKTKIGDLYQLGEHRLVCGDSTQLKIVERLLNGSKVDMVFTDPPYGIDIVKNGTIGGGNKAKPGQYKSVHGDQNTKIAQAAYELCKGMNIPVICFWGGNYFTDFLPPRMGWIVWDKRGEMASNNFSDCELAWTNLNKATRCYKQTWAGMIREGESDKRVHPTQKPIRLAEYCFELLIPNQSIVVDLFGGSGSTMIACEKTKRKCFMSELDPHYCDVIVARWEKYTGKKAKLISRAVKTVKGKEAAKQRANSQ